MAQRAFETVFQSISGPESEKEENQDLSQGQDSSPDSALPIT